MKRSLPANCLLSLAVCWHVTCAGDAGNSPARERPPYPAAVGASAPPSAAGEEAAAYTFKVKHAYPHDREAFTQGLAFQDGVLWESTGRYGTSSLRKVDLQTGKVLQKIDMPSKYFAEGMTILRGRAFQLTWQERKCFVYDAATLKLVGEFGYAGEGWCLTHDGESLIMSDGTNRLRFLDPETFAVRRTVSVYEDGAPLLNLNELEYVRGEIYANVWRSDRVARIDPQTGRVKGWLDLKGLLGEAERTGEEDVLNGIAYDATGDRLFVTGKLWPKLFEIELVKK